MSESTLSVRYTACDPPPLPPQVGTCGPCQTGCTSKSGVQSSSPIRYANGGVLLPQPDLTVPGGGVFSHTRYYCNQASDFFNGPVGFNWWVSSMPFIVASGNSFAVVFDANNPYWFDLSSGGDYVPRYGAVGVTLNEGTSTPTLIFARTVGGQQEITTFNDFTVWPNPGGFLSHTDARGITSTPTIAGDGTTSQLERSFTVGTSTTITETLLYEYSTSGSSQGELASVTLQRQVGSATPTPVQQVVYAYYGASDANGNVNDLQSATQQLPDGMGGWNTVAVEYYRYWLGTETTGIVHGLKMHFGPEAYRLMFNQGIDLSTAADADVLPYADHYFEYDPTSARVTKEIAAVCPGCPGGGTTADLFSYTQNSPTSGWNFNAWTTKTVQTLPDSSSIIIYSNFAALPMLKVIVDPSGLNKWITAYIYNTDGLQIWEAMPSAVNGYDDSYDDLLVYNSGTSSYTYLNSTTGFIKTTDYYTSTGSGAVLDYVQNENVREGQGGSDVRLRSYTYASYIDTFGNAVYPVASLTVYPDATTTSTTIVTGYDCSYSSTNVMTGRTTSLPIISTTQNGPGGTTPLTTVETFDQGNLTQFVDERGVTNSYVYAGPILGAVTGQILNVDSGTGPGLNVTSDFTYDSLGRLTQGLGPTHTVVISGTATSVRKADYRAYIQSILPGSGPWAPDQTLTGNGYLNTSTSAYSLANPVSITNSDKDGRRLDSITSVRTTGSGALSPTDTFDQADWQSWTNIQYDDQHRTIGQSVYFLIPSSGSGAVIVNFGQTTYGYDVLERRNRIVAPGGTITRTVWTTPQWVASVWVGTNDTGATDSDPTGGGATGNNMVQITANVYDGGSAGGDGNLTQVTQYVSATSGDTRVTGYGYDFRDRRTSMTDATNRYTVYTLDNLDRQTQVQSYATSTGNLYAQSQTKYDDRNRVYQTLTYAVDPSTGTPGNALVSNSWYDPSGNLLQQISQGNGQAFTKSAYNGVNWVLSSYLGYNTSGTSYSQAGSVSADIIVEQRDDTFDEAGNVVSAAMSQRLNDASSSTTGALTSSIARISYIANWFDGVDRNIVIGNYGANGGLTRPSTPPASSSSVLVTQTVYNDAAEPYQAIDAMGDITQTSFDDAGRKTTVVEAYGTASARTTNFTWTLDNLIYEMTAVNADTGDQTATWLYGTTLDDSGVARNDLVNSVIYPDGTLGWAELTANQWSNMTPHLWGTLPAGAAAGNDATTTTYNRLGEPATFTDQRGTTRTFTRDKLGRLTDDGVTTVGADTDDAVLRISLAYEIRGMVNLITCANNATPGSGTIVNQVQLTYNTFGQLIEDLQSHSGTTGTANVQYAYDDGSSDSNEIRLNQLTYPNGRAIGYGFGTSGGMSDYLNRVESITDLATSVVLAQYLYLGAGTVIRITYPEPEIRLDLWGGTSGVFNGIDQFGRIIDQRWQNNISTTPTDIDRFKYGRDLNSNPIWKANVVGTAAVTAGLDEFYLFDPLKRLTNMQRGVLTGGPPPTGIAGTPSVEQDWTLDATGNWGQFVTEANGNVTMTQTRTANPANEITAIGSVTPPPPPTGTPTPPAWVTPAYDPAGNMITMPKVSDPTTGFTASFDAWNMLAGIYDGTTPIARYQYDGRKFRILKNTYSGGTLSETRHSFFTAAWQNIEERIGTSTIMDKQYVWGLGYVDQLICRDDATPRRLYACQDANFNLTCIVDASTGDVAERYLFDPYGLRTIMDASWTVLSASAYSWVIGHQGLMHDRESGLLYNLMRYYNPQFGRFVSRDPLPAAQLYEYIDSNPNGATDPFGLQPTTQPSTTQPTTAPAFALPRNFSGLANDCTSVTSCHKSGWGVIWATQADSDKFPDVHATTRQTVTHVSLNIKGKCCVTACILYGEMQHADNADKANTIIQRALEDDRGRFDQGKVRKDLLDYLNALGNWSESDASKAAIACFDHAIADGELSVKGSAAKIKCNESAEELGKYRNGVKVFLDSLKLPDKRANPSDYAK